MGKDAEPAIAIPITRPHLPERERFMALVAELFDTRMLSNFGKYAGLLEQRAAAVVDHPEPLCVSNCDVGMVLAWKALGCSAGEVVVPSFTLCSTVNALVWNGLTPVFADIEPRTLCVDRDEVRRHITPQTVGIAPVHIYGCPAPVAELESIGREHGLKVVFDAAHGVGATYRGRGLGAFGDAAVFSLSGTKLLTASEGGLATFRDPAAAARFRLLRAYGFASDYNCREVGLNGKLSELNAGLGWLSLELLSEAAGRRREQVEQYREALRECAEVSFQHVPEGCAHGYKDLAVLFRQPAQRAAAEEALARRGVQTKRYFYPVHRMDAHARYATGPLPVTDDVYERVLCLPIFFDLSPAQVRGICHIIMNAVQPRRRQEPRAVG